eukprot:evm.model.NODE_3533_length_18743_cov_33.028652.6
MRDLHALHFFLGPDAVVGGVFPHLLVRVELGHVKGVAVGAQLEMHNGAGPVTHALLLLGSLSGVGGVANRGYRWVVGRGPIENRGVGGRRSQKGMWRDHGAGVRRWDGGAGGSQERGRDKAAAFGQQGTGKHGGPLVCCCRRAGE